jgi:hypothetical protein
MMRTLSEKMASMAVDLYCCFGDGFVVARGCVATFHGCHNSVFQW